MFLFSSLGQLGPHRAFLLLQYFDTAFHQRGTTPPVHPYRFSIFPSITPRAALERKTVRPASPTSYTPPFLDSSRRKTSNPQGVIVVATLFPSFPVEMIAPAKLEPKICQNRGDQQKGPALLQTMLRVSKRKATAKQEVRGYE